MPKVNPNSKVFRFCPRCGKDSLKSRSEDSFGCRHCNSEFFLNPAAAVAALIVRPQKELLVVTRNQEPARGTWDLPGGFCKAGEPAEAGLRREIREELNLEIASARYFCSAPNQYLYQDIVYNTIDLAYICEVGHTEPIRINEEIDRFEFVPFSDLDASKFGLASIKDIISNFLLHVKAGEL